MNKKNKFKKIVLINGPNINLLGQRSPEIYGNNTLNELEKYIKNYVLKFDMWKIHFYQSNHEGNLINKIQEIFKKGSQFKGLIINPAGYSHTSISIRDALDIISIKKVEIHLSNINKRETFRKHSYISEVVDVTICGAGLLGYKMAVDYIICDKQEINTR